MDDVKRLWPDESGGNLFESVFDEAALHQRYPRNVTLLVPLEVAVLGEAAYLNWCDAHRPPAPWNGMWAAITVGYNACPAECPACASWRELHAPQK